MQTLVFDGLFLYKDLENNFNNKTSLDLIYEKTKNKNFSRYILLQNGNVSNIPKGIKNVIIKDKKPSNIISQIYKEAKDADDIIIVNVGNPFYDEEYVNKMIEKHVKYSADYTYGLGFPNGLLPVLVNKDILKELVELEKDTNEYQKDYLFHAISKDINSFDIETFLSDIDLRIHRINFGLNDRGEEIFTRNIYDIFKENFTIKKIIEYLNNNIDKLFTIPYLITFELTNYSQVSSIYYPEINEDNTMLDFNLIKKTIDEIIKKNEKINIILGGIGDPLEHDNIIDILQYITSKNIEVIIESTGNNIDNNFLSKLDNIDKEKVCFVIKFDAYDIKTYQIIHANGQFDKISQSIELLKSHGFKVFKQIIRMNENEVEIEKYIRNKEADDIIIRKFSTYCDLLPDKKVVDLAPLERIPCFHLRREIFVKSDGTVPACVYSRYMDKKADLNKQEIKDVIQILKELYIKNSKKEYLEYCKNCNDYYLFNF